MLLARDFRRKAYEALRGKWGMAVGTGFVAGLFGVGTNVGSNYTYRLDQNSFVSPFIVFMLVIIPIWGIIALLVGGAITLGYCRFNRNIIDDSNPHFNDLFSRFDIFWKAFGLRLLIGLYTLLWSLLFIIPGIIAAFSYAMAPYIMEENPGMGINEAIRASKEMMQGNKGRLFCLGFSFIGWAFLCAFTFGIGLLWLTPYMSAAFAAFYNDVSGYDRRKNET